ncbi:hypothetical protein EYF80_047994 [Liparis tanakae]|uniref:Uncharacterized protein n=1 Tax=Liparis tanakae TaxID=230148 RepID=A0A4Z2FL24_9TELE|nr:hypothetical protein EYF80_047994 [Liparis tanakae]
MMSLCQLLSILELFHIADGIEKARLLPRFIQLCGDRYPHELLCAMDSPSPPMLWTRYTLCIPLYILSVATEDHRRLIGPQRERRADGRGVGDRVAAAAGEAAATGPLEPEDETEMTRSHHKGHLGTLRGQKLNTKTYLNTVNGRVETLTEHVEAGERPRRRTEHPEPHGTRVQLQTVQLQTVQLQMVQLQMVQLQMVQLQMVQLQTVQLQTVQLQMVQLQMVQLQMFQLCFGQRIKLTLVVWLLQGSLSSSSARLRGIPSRHCGRARSASDSSPYRACCRTWGLEAGCHGNHVALMPRRRGMAWSPQETTAAAKTWNRNSSSHSIRLETPVRRADR